MTSPVLPKVTDSPEVHADWLEWSALRSPAFYTSWADHQRDLRIGGFDESEHEEGEEGELEILTDTTIQELSERSQACSGGYPFDVTRDGLLYQPSRTRFVYEFLLSLTLRGRKAGAPGQYGERLFEDLCAEVLHSYLGKASDGLSSFVFGFPRRIQQKGFAKAVDRLCADLGEGIGHKEAPETPGQKDARLDVVAWRRFPDRKPGQLIAFGQCATGEDWFDKINELRPSRWCRAWLREPPLVDPITGFFTPRRVERDQWRIASIYGGIVFDRCRISWLVTEASGSLAQEIVRWNSCAFGAA